MLNLILVQQYAYGIAAVERGDENEAEVKVWGMALLLNAIVSLNKKHRQPMPANHSSDTVPTCHLCSRFNHKMQLHFEDVHIRFGLYAKALWQHSDPCDPLTHNHVCKSSFVVTF